MDPVSGSLKLSAAGLRAAGYAIESQLRLVHVLGRSALQCNPFLVRSPVRRFKSRTIASDEVKVSAKPPPKAAKPAPAKSGANAATGGGAAKPAPARATTDKPTRSRPAAAKPPRRTRQPSMPPPLPPARSGGMTDA